MRKDAFLPSRLTIRGSARTFLPPSPSDLVMRQSNWYCRGASGFAGAGPQPPPTVPATSRPQTTPIAIPGLPSPIVPPSGGLRQVHAHQELRVALGARHAVDQ